MKAKYPGKCRQCQYGIVPGEEIHKYRQGVGWQHEKCPTSEVGNDKYALVIHGCDQCGLYPIQHVEIAGQGYVPQCPRCKTRNVHWEKAYRADRTGRVLE